MALCREEGEQRVWTQKCPLRTRCSETAECSLQLSHGKILSASIADRGLRAENGFEREIDGTFKTSLKRDDREASNV